jgi:hypothetical protein
MGYEYHAELPEPLSPDTVRRFIDAIAANPEYEARVRSDSDIGLNFPPPEYHDPIENAIHVAVSDREIYVLFNWGNLKTQIPPFLSFLEEVLAKLDGRVKFEDL